MLEEDNINNLNHIFRKNLTAVDIPQHLLTGAYRHLNSANNFNTIIAAVFVCT